MSDTKKKNMDYGWEEGDDCPICGYPIEYYPEKEDVFCSNPACTDEVEIDVV